MIKTLLNLFKRKQKYLGSGEVTRGSCFLGQNQIGKEGVNSFPRVFFSIAEKAEAEKYQSQLAYFKDEKNEI